MSYDDMMGLEMYDGLEALLDPEAVKQLFIAGGAAGLGLMGASFGLRKINIEGWDPKNVARLRGGASVLAGLVGAKLLYSRNRDAAMAVFGALAGLGITEIASTFVDLGQAKPGLSALPEDLELRAIEDDSLMGNNYGEEMAALADLSAPQVAGSRPAFSGFADSTVTRAQLEAAVVQGETLGNLNAYFGDADYAPYNA